MQYFYNYYIFFLIFAIFNIIVLIGLGLGLNAIILGRKEVLIVFLIS